MNSATDEYRAECVLWGKKYLEKGFQPIRAKRMDKVPVDKAWQRIENDSDDYVNQWSKESFNMGLITGRTNKEDKFLGVIDCDVKEPNGVKEFLDWAKKNDVSTKTLSSITPSGGRHLFYWFTEPVKGSVSKILKNVDVRGTGCQVIVHPSVRVIDDEVKQYQWVDFDSEILDAPAALEQLVREEEKVEVIIEEKLKEESEIDFSFISDEQRLTLFDGLIAAKKEEAFQDYNSWLSLGIALKNCGYKSEDWVKLSDEEAEIEINQKWNGLNKKDSLNEWNYLRNIAKQYDPLAALIISPRKKIELHFFRVAIDYPEILGTLFANTQIIKDEELKKAVRGAYQLYKNGTTGKALLSYLQTASILSKETQKSLAEISVSTNDKILFDVWFSREINKSTLENLRSFAEKKHYRYSTQEFLNQLAFCHPNQVVIPNKPVIIDSVSSIKSWIHEIKDNQTRVITTKFVQLNYFLGGFKRKSLCCVMAVSGKGKSLLLTNITRGGIEQMFVVLFVSTEMPAYQVNERIIRSATRQKDNNAAAMQYIKLLESQSIGTYEVWAVEKQSISAIDIENHIKESNLKPDMIIVDYADDLLPSVSMDNEYQKQGQIFSELSRLAQRLDVPVITATQASRAAKNNGSITSEHLADSWKKLQPLEAFLTIPDFDIANNPEMATRKDLRIDKNRSGISDVVMQFEVDYSTWTITEVEKSRKLVEHAIENNIPPNVLVSQHPVFITGNYPEEKKYQNRRATKKMGDVL